MLWEDVYIGSQMVCSFILGLCHSLPTKASVQSTIRRSTKPKRVTKKTSHTPARTADTKDRLKKAHAEEETKSLGLLLALEPRIMFDGAAFVTGAEIIQDQSTQEIDLQAFEPKSETEPFSDPFTKNIDLFSALSTTMVPSDRKEIVFIDTNVDGYETLLLGIDPHAEAILLDSTRDGIEQIAEILGQQSDLDAIHIISHGNQGELRLGTGVLNLASMQGEYADELAIINEALTDEADFLIYGCNFGEGQIGQKTATLLAEITGTDVAASIDDTGSAQYKANWELEYQTGKIETQVAVNAEAQENWVGKLAVITVDTFADVVNGGDGVTSLREAIIAANAGAGGDTINLAAGTYTLSIAGTGEDAAATGDLDINKDVTLTGVGAGTTIIDGNGIDRVFHIKGTSNTATISGVTIQGGDQSNGGGIFVDTSSTLDLSDAHLTGNNHSGAGSGGAIHVHGTANLNRVLLSGNTADLGGAIGYHGATGGSLTNVTISGNTSAGNGGGLWTDTAITLKNTTITLNQGNNGGGIFSSGATVTISNTIVSDNTGTSSNDDVAGTYSSDGSNLIETVGGASGFVGGDMTGASANLVALADNGGPTQTHALLTGNAAINAGTTSGAPAVDQRGVARDAMPDIGAFELAGAAAPTLDLDTNDSSGATGNDYAFPFTESDVATAIADMDTDIVVGGSSTFASVKLAISGLLDGNAETLVLDGSTFALATAVAGQDTTSYHVVIGTGAGTATMTITKRGGGTFSEIETETLITAIRYQHTNTNTPTDGNRLIDVIVNDGTSDSAAARSTINVNPTNDQPSFTGLDNTPTFITGGIAIVLDNNATISDPELDAINNYNGATLTLARNGGANAEDLFDGSGTLSTLTESGNVVVGITTIGTVTTNSSGTLVLTFNGNATSALVNSALQQITYANSSGTPPANVQIDFTINDNNLGAQGSGGARNDTGSITVTIAAVNIPPVAVADGFTVLEGSTNTLNLAGNDTDADDGLDLTSITIISDPTNGSIDNINPDGTVTYTHNGSETISDSFTYTIKDLSGATSNTVTVSLIVTPQNDAPIITSNGGGANTSISIPSGNTFVTNVIASDAEGSSLIYSITGGADAALFNIDFATGVLTFRTAPNIQTPTDVGGDNVYDVIVQASDGTLTDTQAIAVTISDVPVVVLPPTADPPSESPSESGEEDAGESEDTVAGNVLPVGSGSHSHGSNGHQSSTDDGPNDTNQFNHQAQDNSALMEHLRAGNRLNGGAGVNLMDLLPTSFSTTTLKSEMDSLLGTSSGFLKDLDQARDALNDIVATEKTYVASSIAASTGLSVGYVFWLLRSGVLLTALLSSVPAWQFVNPLLVLDTPKKKKPLKGHEDLEDDSVESMFEHRSEPTQTSHSQTQ